MELEKILTENDSVTAGDRMEVEIGLTGRIGIDGISVTRAQIAEDGNLHLDLSNGIVIDAGRALGPGGVHGLAGTDTEPEFSPDSRVYIGSGRGTYANFRDRNGQPIRIEKENCIVFFHSRGNESVWDYNELELDMSDYQPKHTFTHLSTGMPPFTSYPYDVTPLPDCYDPLTGKFSFPPQCRNLTSQTEFFGKTVYRDCQYILIGFNMDRMFYLETATGACMLMNTVDKTCFYHELPFAAEGISMPLVRVDSHSEASQVITVEQSENGIDYHPYAVIDRNERYLYPIDFRSIGFFQPDENTEPKILSVGMTDRLSLDEVARDTDTRQEVFEVISPADNTAGIKRQTISLQGFRRRNEIARLATGMPVLCHYPYSAVPAQCYDEGTGKFLLPEGIRCVTSQSAWPGTTVYRNCRYILLGFNMESMVYLETETGRCALFSTAGKEFHYPGQPVAPEPVTKKYVRVTTDENSETLLIEQSQDGNQYTEYATVDRNGWFGHPLTYLSIGFYQPEGAGEPQIVSLGNSERLDLDGVVRVAQEAAEEIEFLAPSDNTAGIAVKKVKLRQRPFAGKSIALFGDSITAEAGVPEGIYTGQISAKTGVASVTRFGYSGARIGSTDPGRNDTIATEQRLGEVLAASADRILILAGTNDYWFDVPPGEVHVDPDDPEHRYTTSGSLRYILDYLLLRKMPEQRILFITPPPGHYLGRPDTEPNGEGFRMSDYVERMKGVCRDCHVPVCDAWSLAGWYPPAEAVAYHYTTDGVHLSEAGYDRLTDLIIAEALRSMP